jgi:hypothetical protein
MRSIRSQVFLPAILVTGLVACTPHIQRTSAGIEPAGTASERIVQHASAGMESVGAMKPVGAMFEPVAQVLRHPRCLNCHTTSDYPRQGDDRHPHRFLVARGLDDRGAYGERCNECHQGQNQNNGVPGAQGWRLAPLTMAWETQPGKALSTASLCHRLLDQSHNGNRNLTQLEQHLQTEPLVQWAWAPGHTVEGTPRALPPLTHDQFLQAFRTWKAAGAPCPHE